MEKVRFVMKGGEVIKNELKKWKSEQITLEAIISISPLHVQSEHVAAIVAHARETAPLECCGLIGGINDYKATTIYRLRNVTLNPQVAYEAAPEELFAAQRQMRERGETLLAIYHSHPRAIDPSPSETDVRLAYYPSATYLIVGLAGAAPVVKAFTISEREQRWQQVEYVITD